MVRRTLVALAALSVSGLLPALSAPKPQNSDAAQTPATSPSSAGRSEAAAKPEAAGKSQRSAAAVAASKLELRDINPSARPAVTPLVLKNAGAMSTEDVARGAAADLANQNANQASKQGADPALAQSQAAMPSNSKAKAPAQDLALNPGSSSDAVLEFQPASSGSGLASKSDSVVIPNGVQGKSPLNRVHGDLYGAAGAAGHAAGGSVGAASKSGKTSIYVQSDEARSKVGQPQ